MEIGKMPATYSQMVQKKKKEKYVDRESRKKIGEREKTSLEKNAKSSGKGYSTRMLCELFSNFSVSLKLFQNRKLKTWPSVLNPSLTAEPQRKGLASLVSVMLDPPDLSF